MRSHSQAYLILLFEACLEPVAHVCHAFGNAEPAATAVVVGSVHFYKCARMMSVYHFNLHFFGSPGKVNGGFAGLSQMKTQPVCLGDQSKALWPPIERAKSRTGMPTPPTRPATASLHAASLGSSPSSSPQHFGGQCEKLCSFPRDWPR